MISEFPELLPIFGHSTPDLIRNQLNIISRKGTNAALRIDPRHPYASSAIPASIGAIRDHAEALVIIVDLKSMRGEYTDAKAAATSFLTEFYRDLGGEAESLTVVLLSNSFPVAKTSLKDLSRTLTMREVWIRARSSFRSTPPQGGD